MRRQNLRPLHACHATTDEHSGRGLSVVLPSDVSFAAELIAPVGFKIDDMRAVVTQIARY